MQETISPETIMVTLYLLVGLWFGLMKPTWHWSLLVIPSVMFVGTQIFGYAMGLL